MRTAREIGLEQGERKARREIAKKLKDMNIDKEKIKEITDLEIEEIENL